MRITRLELASTMLNQQQAFYTRLLEREPSSAHDQQLCYGLGYTELCFIKAEKPLPGRYHFAFNIPENQFDEATAWVRQYVSLVHDTNRDELFYSESWNAHNLYFYDAEGNIVELIARHTLANASNAPFSAQSLENISEIGVACDDFASMVAELEQRYGARPYNWSGSDTFMPIGDEHGLFIVVKPGRIWFPDTGIPAVHLPLRVKIDDQVFET